MTALADLENIALQRLMEVPEGPSLDPLAGVLIELGCCVSVCTLDQLAIDRSIEQAFVCGASMAQVQEVIALVSGLGVHSLMVSAVSVLSAARRHGQMPEHDALDAPRQVLWDKFVGTDPFWAQFEVEVPGFLKALLLLSPDIFSGFFAYCAIPWTSGTVRALIKELVALASDATPMHRFEPGFRVHLNNAIGLGAGRTMVLETLRIAARTPVHQATD
jgi:hypothetical protein